MNYVPGETSLVIAGSWNAAILTPPWVQQHALSQQGDQQSRVQMLFPAFGGGFFEPPRFSINEFSYIVRPDGLVIAPGHGDAIDFDLWESAAARILEVLEHTPIGGLGHNFEFRAPEAAGTVLDVFTNARQDVSDVIPNGWNPGAVAITSAFSNDGGSVVMTMNRQFDAGSIVLKFNFHHPVTTGHTAIAVLRGENGYARMAQNLAIAKELVAQLYGRSP